ncbi:MAG: hypothetical protein PF569_04435 [Candidatus Woesearchaeota archaeon]|jgi:hypothetical protein|nr:hypothetical protein [Candidatus Woesearchaeota archaeon]
MFKSKRGQQAVEFMLILMFVLTIIAGVMYITGSLLGDFVEQDKKNVAENFLENIVKEIEILNTVNGGYSRNLDVYSQDYHIEILNEMIIIKDLYDENMTYYYNIPVGLNITVGHKIAGNGQNITVINFLKESEDIKIELLTTN